MASILIVEDDTLICELAGMMISDWGHGVILASDSDEALAIIKSAQIIDILFTDIYLKREVFGGCKLAHQAVRLRPSLRVIYTTGNSITETLRAQFVDGAQFVSKPYPAAQLQRFIADALPS
jgi:DNA-binding NtrC family response regulator